MDARMDLTHRPGDLSRSKSSQELLDHHELVLTAHYAHDQMAQTCADFLRGVQYSEEDLRAFRAKRKTPVVYNKLKVFARTMVGSFLQNKYDVKFSPVEPGDDELAEVMEKIRIWQAGVCQDRKWVPEIVQRAYAMGRAYVECWMDVQPGRVPRMNTRLLPTLAVHWDPESRDTITRRDAAFVDIDSWLSLDQLIDEFPDKRSRILEGAIAGSQGQEGYTAIPSIENFQATEEYRNGRYRVVERYYKVRSKRYYAVVDGHRMDVEKEDIEQFVQDYPGAQLYAETGWRLHLAVAAAGLQGNFYLYNGPYHCNPLDPTTGDVLWPVVELVAESLEGQPQGFVEPELDPQRAFNALMSNVLHSAKHASSQAKLIDFEAFVSDEEAKRAQTFHSDADMAFRVRPGRTMDAMKPIEHSTVTSDTYQAMDITGSYMLEASSTPPALQGVQESAGTSGILNAQRIEQSYIQLQGFVANFRSFLEALYTLRYAYTRIYYTDELVVRITEEGAKGSPEFLEVNKPQVSYGQDGRAQLTILNDLDSILFDITVEDSTRTPTYRARIMEQITQLFQSNAVANDPVLGAALFGEYAELSDLSGDTKELIKNYNTLLQQWEVTKKELEQAKAQLDTQQQQLQVQGMAQQQEQQGVANEMQNYGQMQALAQAEAEQTMGAMQPPAEAAGSAMQYPGESYPAQPPGYAQS